MANTLTQVGIETGNIVEAYHVTQSIDAFTGTVDYDIFLSGSFNMTGSINGEPGVINPLTASYAITTSYAETASYAVSASYEINYETSSSYAETASIAESASYSLTASYVENAQTASYVENAQTASYVTLAQTASYVTLAQTASYVENAQSASYVNLIAGPNIDINQVGNAFEISASAGGGSIDTGSFYYSSSINSNVITFYQGDGTNESITVNVTESISNTITQFGGVNVVSITTQLYTIPNSGSYRLFNNFGGAICTITMPSVAQLGDVIEIIENAASRTRIDVSGTGGAGQAITLGSNITTIGAAGAVDTQQGIGGDDHTYLKLICTNSGSGLNAGQRWRIVEATSDSILDAGISGIYPVDAIILS